MSKARVADIVQRFPFAARVRALFEAEQQVRPAQVGFAGNVANFLSDDSRLMLAEAATRGGQKRGGI